MRYIIGFLISIGLLILVLVLIFNHGSSPAPTKTPQLADYADTSTTVRYIDDYPITAAQTHNETITTVGKDQVTFVVTSGYEGQVLRSQTYQNSSAAYVNFLKALQVEGYTTGNDASNLQDERGVCPKGHRYIFEITDGSRIIQHFWKTSCGSGTFNGKTDTVRDLFRRQVPDYNKLTNGISNF